MRKYPDLKPFKERKNKFFRYWLENPSYKELIYPELIRLQRNHGPVWEGLLISALDYINKKIDCSDFLLLGMERILLQFKHSRLLSSRFKEYLKETILTFKYNSNMYGRDKIAPAEKRIDAWLDLRLRTGFSEWLSNVYYDEDITALVNLIDFSDNSELTGKAQEVLNSIFLDMALNSFYGIFGSTHGRSYTEEKQNPLTESTIDTEKLLFGMGIYAGEDNMSSFVLALSSKYRMPDFIGSMAFPEGSILKHKRRGQYLYVQMQRL